MIANQLVREHLERAMEEPSSVVAEQIFAVARRCDDLVQKNRRLKKLAARAQIMLDGDSTDLQLTNTQFPEAWRSGFETGWKAYLRHIAVAAPNYESRRKLERGADDIFSLEARNRAIRENLDKITDHNREDPRWLDWVNAYEAEVEEQAECYCCGNSECCICSPCWVQRHKIIPLGEDSESGDVGTPDRAA